MCVGKDLSYKWRALKEHFGSKGESKHGRHQGRNSCTASTLTSWLYPTPHRPNSLAWHSALSEEQRNLTNCLLLREKGSDSPVTSFISLWPFLSSRKSLLIYRTERSINLNLFHHKTTSPPKNRISCLPGTWICPSLVTVCLLTSQRHYAA